jgi:hypothetical protein
MAEVSLAFRDLAEIPIRQIKNPESLRALDLSHNQYVGPERRFVLRRTLQLVWMRLRAFPLSVTSWPD